MRQLRRRVLQQSYVDAFAEWDAFGDAEWWETVTGDGLDDAAR